jgi:hypothetical protein
MKYCTNINLVKPTVTIYSKWVQPNLICIFRTYILFSMIFRISRHFLGIFLNRKEKKTSPGARPGFLPKAIAQGRSGPLASRPTAEEAQPARLTRGQNGAAWPTRWPARRAVTAVGARMVARLPAAPRHLRVNQDPRSSTVDPKGSRRAG